MKSQMFLAYIDGSTIVEILILGLVAGLLLDLCLRGRSFGFWGNTLLGIAGAIVGTFLWDYLLNDHIKVDIGSVTIRFAMVLVALLGSFLLLMIIRLITNLKRNKQR